MTMRDERDEAIARATEAEAKLREAREFIARMAKLEHINANDRIVNAIGRDALAALASIGGEQPQVKASDETHPVSPAGADVVETGPGGEVQWPPCEIAPNGVAVCVTGRCDCKPTPHSGRPDALPGGEQG